MSLKPKKDIKLPSLKGLNMLSLIRAAAAIVVLILANVLNADKLIFVLLALAAALIAGYEIIIAAVASVKKKDYFSYEILVLAAAVGAFCVGCINEACLLVVFYLVLKTFLDFLVLKANSSASDYIDEGKADDLLILRTILSQSEAKETSAEKKLAPYVDAFTKAAVLVGVIYAVFMPLITDINYADSIKRGLMLILLASPLPLLCSLPISAVVGLSHNAASGVFIRDAETLEKIAKLNTVVIDKEDVITDGEPLLVSFTSPVFDNDTFIRLAAHVAYNSEQSIAKPILAAYKGDFRPEIIGKFKEVFGNSMEITIKNIPICLCTREVLDTRRIEAPTAEGREGLVLYMTVAGKYAGAMQFAERIKSSAKDAISEIKAINDIDVILVTEDCRSISKKLADELDVDEFICECDTAKKFESVESAVSRLDEADILMYISGENLEYHTTADIDAKIGYAADNADVLLANGGIDTLPYVCNTAKRTRKIQRENTIFAVIIKLTLIIMAFAGIVTLWFVALADMTAAMLTIINTSRISDESVITKMQNKL